MTTYYTLAADKNPAHHRSGNTAHRKLETAMREADKQSSTWPTEVVAKDPGAEYMRPLTEDELKDCPWCGR